MKPQNSLILIEVEEEQEKATKSGVIIPKTAEDKAINSLRIGTVIAVNRKEEEENDIKVGDEIYFDKYAIKSIPTEKNKFLVRKEDIYLVL
jgi:co-chaperonin GroES (HSP10)